MNDVILDLIDSLYEEHIKEYPQTDRESFNAGAESIILNLAKNNSKL